MNGKRQLHGSFNHGSMANAMPQALGAQGAHPGRQVVSLSGDGGLSMLLGDLLTARQLKLPIKIVVYNNSLLGFVSMELKAAGYLDTNVDLATDFAAIAKGAGIFSVRVEHSENVEEALRMAFAHDGPAVVDVVTSKYEPRCRRRSNSRMRRASACSCCARSSVGAATRSSSWREPTCGNAVPRAMPWAACAA